MPEIDVTCFHCSQMIGDPPLLNEMPDGEACPVCRDRVLEAQTPIFHRSLAASGAGPPVVEEAVQPDSHLRLLGDNIDNDHPA